MQKEVEGNKRITQCMGCMEIYEAFDDICPYCGYINGTMPEEMYHLEPGKGCRKACIPFCIAV